MANFSADRFTRSLQLVKASWEVLRSDRELLFLPLLSFMSLLFVIYVFAIAVHAAGIPLPKAHGGHHTQLSPLLYGVLFVFYLVSFFVIFFFNTALVGAALDRLEGGNPTVGSALALALQRIGPIFGYALFSATVGLFIALVVERVAGLLGRLAGSALNVAWTVATFLVTPILAAEDVGPLDAVVESARLVRKTWGENLIGTVGISLAMSTIGGFIVLGGILLGMMLDVMGLPVPAIAVMVASGLVFAASLLVGTALRGIYVAAVYYYAVSGKSPWGFEGHVLEGAFTQRQLGFSA